MANVVTYGKDAGLIQVVFDGSTAWDLGVRYRIASFEFYPNTNNDIITVRDGSATGPIVFKQRVSGTTGVADQRKSYEGEGGRDIHPYVKGDEVSASSTLVVKYL